MAKVIDADTAPFEDKKSKKEADAKKKDKKQPKERKFHPIKKLKETGSELKKVTWPKFGEVVKKTGIVIAVVLFFTAALFLMDMLLKVLYQLLMQQPVTLF